MYQDEPGTTEEGDVVEKLTALEAYRAGSCLYRLATAWSTTLT